MSATILIVDDYPENLAVFVDTLTQAGYTTLVAESGAGALAQLRAGPPPDLILLDVLMPAGLDGFETCRRLKAAPALAPIPVIFMTALGETIDKVTGLALGAVDYLAKPVAPAELLARVQAHLRIRELQLALERNNAALAEEIALRAAAEAQLEHSLDRAVLVVDAAGSVLFASQLARLVLARWFGTAPDRAQLPPALAAWCDAVWRGTPHTPGSWLHLAPGGRIEARFFAPRGADDCAMLLLEEKADASPAALHSLGLSAREAEVLYWLSEGKSYKDIAIILACESRTAQKHAQNLFRKLGVENRHAATLRAQEALARG